MVSNDPAFESKAADVTKARAIHPPAPQRPQAVEMDVRWSNSKNHIRFFGFSGLLIFPEFATASSAVLTLSLWERVGVRD